ncbi:U-box domain-containing protein 1 [Beta vulgaris subsp. vulgaris]|uniref:U-box domain-containing protein 1 n=1 Tax=Beta vulgaris subsp. vulgaris TaxID=3555 RepID=UPI002036E054|nr:U-box domain-containing protein 1 [Beta vulgaris subsp. vulgaris]
MTRRIRLLSPLFTEVQELKIPLLPSAILCFTELLSLMTKVKLLIQGCTEDIREQVELLCKQAKRLDLSIDPKELERRSEVLQIIATAKETNEKNYGFLDVEMARELLSSIGLRSPVEFAEETSKLKAEATSQSGTGGPLVVSKINSLISLLSYLRSMIFSFEENEISLKLLKQKTTAKKLAASASSSSRAILTDIPNQFCCPISYEVMIEPVTVATGHTYDLHSISKWLNSGRKSCPKSGWKLTHLALIPNYNLKSLIHQWHQDNNIPLNKLAASSSEFKMNKEGQVCTDYIRFTSEFLVGKLATASREMQCRAAYEIRLLAKSSMNNRKIIAEAGAIPFLVNFLSSQEPIMQENAVTALLNLSIYSNNKVLIMEAAALQKLIEVLENGKTIKARENAAATISSLSIVDYYKEDIGAQSSAIAALTRLLREGTTTGKRDAVSALINLALYQPNQTRIVHEGAVPLVVDILMDDRAGITDDALALLALLSGCSEGMKEITRSKDLTPFLIDLLRFGSPKGKENSVALLLGLSNDGAEIVRHLDPQTFSLLRSLIANGSFETQERASLLLSLELVARHHKDRSPHNSGDVVPDIHSHHPNLFFTEVGMSVHLLQYM